MAAYAPTFKEEEVTPTIEEITRSLFQLENRSINYLGREGDL